LPFGEELNATGTTDKHKFTSYERDSETGTDYAVNRQYAQNAGRFMRPDPYEGSDNPAIPQSLNRFSYVEGDPVNSVDPTGLFLGPDFGDPCFNPILGIFTCSSGPINQIPGFRDRDAGPRGPKEIKCKINPPKLSGQQESNIEATDRRWPGSLGRDLGKKITPSTPNAPLGYWVYQHEVKIEFLDDAYLSTSIQVIRRVRFKGYASIRDADGKLVKVDEYLNRFQDDPIGRYFEWRDNFYYVLDAPGRGVTTFGGIPIDMADITITLSYEVKPLDPRARGGCKREFSFHLVVVNQVGAWD
jgi:RHS repeat-associated protein